MSHNFLLKKALQYSRMGLHVFPVREKDEGEYYSNKLGATTKASPKRPRTENGFKDSTTSENQIITWWNTRGWENSAIGIDCGASKLFVIDIDRHRVDGIGYYEHLNIPEKGVWVSKTGGDGKHIIFSDPDGIGRTRSFESVGIDTKSKGGYIIAPPSFIVGSDGSKKRYEVLRGWKDVRPAQISWEILNLLGIEEPVERDKFVPDTEDVVRDFKKAKTAIMKLNESFLENYSAWIAVGMSLRMFGEYGLRLWEQWTEKKYFSKYPNSKRMGTLEYKWKSFQNVESGYGLGSLIYWSKGGDFR